jgi:hypothetical protein
VKKLKVRRRKAEHRLERRQAVRERIRKFVRWARKRGMKGLAQAAERVEGRLTEKIKELHELIADLTRQIEKLEAQRESLKEKFIEQLQGMIGLDENDAKIDGMVRELMGYGSADSIPWCSIMIGWLLKHLGVPLPASVAYSGAWLNWAHAHRVNYADRQPGDILVFDWGDGGMTDHVATYVGGGLMIGGNQRDTDTGGQVSRTTVPTNALVGTMRIEWDELD